MNVSTSTQACYSETKMNYRSDTQQTKLPARQSQCARYHTRPRPVIFPCDAYADRNAYRETWGADDSTAASLQAWYPSHHLHSEDASGWP
jgi:hypothetical protein